MIKKYTNIPVQDCVKYLGIHLSKKHLVRQRINFSPKMKKTQNIFNTWLQRDLSILGKVLLSRAEGLSRFVYPSLSLFVNPSTCKEINKTFDFIWKNKSVLSNKRAEGGLEVLDFVDINNTFNINWFLLTCNYIPERLPAKLARFHQQALMACTIFPHIKLFCGIIQT